MRFLLSFMLLAVPLLGVTHAAETLNATYSSGHGALQVFDEQGWQLTPQWVKVWIGIMAISFMVGIVFVKNHAPARWVIGGFIAGILFNQFGFAYLGLQPISGLIALTHLLFWTPGLYQVLREKAFLGKVSAYTIWAGWIALVIIFSFIFDIRDAAIYLQHSLLQ